MAKVASRNGVTVANLARWNDIKTTAKLSAGQSLDIYKPVKIQAAGVNNKKAAPSKQVRSTVVTKKAADTKVAQKSKGGTPTKKKR